MDNGWEVFSFVVSVWFVVCVACRFLCAFRKLPYDCWLCRFQRRM